MTRQADYEMRTFKPNEVTDPNGNRVKVDYTPLGLIAKKARMGKASETKGDTLSDPGRSFTYDFGAFDASGEPVSVTTTERVHHVNATYSPADPGEKIETVEYSDGMGRSVQTRVQAEDLDFGDAGLTPSSVGDAVGSTPSSGPRVRVTGWTRYNNKGDVVEKWEPFFAEGFGFESVDPGEDDASITMHYDAKGRKVRTVRPDGGESRVVFGVPGTIATPDVTTPESFEPTPWEQYTYDANDNGGRTNISDVAESGFSGHFDTPTSVVQDARGRAIETTERNGPTSSDWHTTQTDYDIRGNVTKVIDARGNVAAEQVFDLADQTIRTESIDAGHSTAVFDAAGTSIEARDGKGGLTLKTADELLRPTKVWGRDTDASSEDVRLIEETLYGDGPNGPSSPADTNHLGKPYRAYDEAGRVETAEYDFKGNVLETTRRVIDPQLMIDAYQAADSSNNWAVDTYRVDWSRESGETRGDVESELLKSQDYTTTKAYDGLDRSRQVTYPEDNTGSRKVLEPTYNKAGSLQAVELDGSTYVDHIAYNPKGQRILAALGCGVMTRYDYDDESMRLVRLRSEGYTKPDSTTYAPDGTTPHQDFSYTYDGVGNVTQIDSTGNNVGIGGTNSLTRTFEYDPLYRLTEATGREYAANPSNPWDYMPAGGNANDPNQTRAYTEEYDYDEVGNMKTLTHDYGAGSGTWTRDYVTESTTNRLDQMTSAGGTHQYTYDDAGNLRTENTDRKYEWDARGRMRSFRNQVSGSQATVFAHYTYDGGGQRVQKVVSKDSGKPVHSVYIGGIFEHHERIDAGSVAAEVNHLHVMDDQKRVAIERVGSELDGSNPPTTQYHLGDHLQSSNVVLDGTGTLFNREEYRPFGESSFGSYETKRYRFTGQERDEESSLSYHGARYYAPWTAQWTSPDPKGMVDGTNLYGYSRNNPVNRRDPGGMQSKKTRGPKPRSGDVSATSEKGSTGSNSSEPSDGSGQGDDWPDLQLKTRGLGALQGLLGVLEVGGAAASTITGPGSALAVTLLLTTGVDNAVAGAQQAWSGTPTSSLTSQVLQETAEAGGASPQTARQFSFVAELALSGGASYVSATTTRAASRASSRIGPTARNGQRKSRSRVSGARGDSEGTVTAKGDSARPQYSASELEDAGKNWVPKNEKSPRMNAFDHWGKHKDEFPELQGPKHYAKEAEDFLDNPPDRALTGIRESDKARVVYDPETNRIGFQSEGGRVKSYFKPDPKTHDQSTNLEYFQSQIQ